MINKSFMSHDDMAMRCRQCCQFTLYIIITVTILLSAVKSQYNGDEDEPFHDQQLTAAEKYIDFITNGGQAEDIDDSAEVTNDLNYESETFDMLLKGFYSVFHDLSADESKEKLKEYIDDMDLNDDGYVSRDELKKWIIAQAEKGATLDAMGMTGLDAFDLNRDNKLSWHEIFEDLKKLGSMESHGFKKSIEMERVRFDHADKNNDKHLDESEYPRYATPEYFTEMANYTILSYIADYDHDRDHKISKEEFLMGFDSKTDEEGYKFEAEKFNEMDKDKNGFLTPDEVSNVALEFSIQTYTNKKVNNLFFHVDTDKDGKLSKLEILSSYPLFTTSKTEEDSEHELSHDEL